VFMGLAEYQKAVAAKTMPPPDQRGTCPAFRQTAQDGVQFAFENYEHPELQPPLQSKDNFALAPGNRADILVRAPTTLGNSVLAFGPRPPGKGGPTIVAHVVVESGASGYNTKWPEKREEYPTIPMFLDDINKWKNQPGDTKTLRFSMAGNGQPPLIDGEPFKEGYYNQTMELGDSEQWMIINESTAMHPFHIHVNPFQLVEIFDPVTMLEPKRLPGPWIWWDTMPLPSAGSYQNDKTKPVQSGHVRIRHNFVDFPGSFVLHCHILAHEDRGMMQLVRVVDNKTHIKHH
jgi:FtsP/CotA-like multicopper oxidase with cupredoxin domain